MNNPHIIGKVLITLIFMLFALLGWMVYQDIDKNRKCEDAGGILAASVCINPGSVIEVD